MKRLAMVLGLAVALGLLGPPGPASAWGHEFRGAPPSAFPVVVDPWSRWGRPIHHHRVFATPSAPSQVIVAPPGASVVVVEPWTPLVWVPGSWAWNGFNWVWFEGHWTR